MVVFSITILLATTVFMTAITMPNELINPSDLNKSGIKNLKVEYSDSKIYLDVELNNSRTCSELTKILNIQSVIIKTKSYLPACSIITENLLRITYSPQS